MTQNRSRYGSSYSGRGNNSSGSTRSDYGREHQYEDDYNSVYEQGYNHGYEDALNEGEYDDNEYDEEEDYDDNNDDSDEDWNDEDDNDESGNRSRRGFAAMSKEKRTRIARKGGKASHRGDSNRGSSSSSRSNRNSDHNHSDSDDSGSSNRGFASMSQEKRRRIAAKGGHASHSGGRRSGYGSRSNNR